MSEENKEEVEQEETEETETVEASAEDVKTEMTDEETDIEEDDKEEEKSVPYSRFKTKVDEVNELKAELAALKGDTSQQTNETETETTETVDTETEIENPLQEKVTRYEQLFNTMYQSKLSQIPVQYQDLIPDVDDVAKLAWIENAVAKGLFSVDKPKDFGGLGANPNEEEKPNNNKFIRDLGRKF